jgi:hypothetical protein
MAEINNMVFPKGKLDRTLLFKAAAPAGGIGDGAILYSKMYQTIDTALRLETGAQATPGEIQVKMNEFWPSAKDTEKAIRSKMSDLNQYITRLQKLNDPTGQLKQMGGNTTSLTPESTRGLTATPQGTPAAGTPFMENGVKKVIGPDGKKYRWIE